MVSLERQRPSEQCLPLSEIGQMWFSSPWMSIKSDNTIDAYHNDYTDFSNFLLRTNKQLTSSDLSGINLQRYKTHLEANGFKPGTIARRLASMRSLIKWASDEALILPGQLNNLPDSYKVPPRQVKEITVDQLETLRKNLASDLRAATIAELIIQTGARMSEITELKVSDVQLVSNKDTVEKTGVQFVNKRTGNITIGYLDQNGSAVLSGYLQENSLEDKSNMPLFPNRQGEPYTRQALWLMMRPHLGKIGLRSPDDLRSAVAMRNFLRLKAERRPDVRLTTIFSRTTAS